MNWIVYLLFLFELVHTLQWLSMDSSTSKRTKREIQILKNRAILYFQKLQTQTNSVLRDEKPAENAKKRQQWQNS